MHCAAAESFPDYNLRKYVQRRVADLQHSAHIQQDISKLQEMVKLWERQAAVYQQYARPQKGIMVRVLSTVLTASRHKSLWELGL